jgi:predicted SAM-dependent methyltransferase
MAKDGFTYQGADMKELILGAGSTSKEKVLYDKEDKSYQNPVRLDMNKDHNPDVVWNLNDRPLPFANNEFDEIHAYEVLEHVGQQGDYEGFFKEFEEYYRILKPGGRIYGSVPRWDSMWATADPSHTRVISEGTLVFLSQDQYELQVGVTAMSDFRSIYKANFVTMYTERNGENLFFVLEKADV